jgi:hypothetical protein
MCCVLPGNTFHLNAHEFNGVQWYGGKWRTAGPRFLAVSSVLYCLISIEQYSQDPLNLSSQSPSPFSRLRNDAFGVDNISSADGMAEELHAGKS